MLSAFREMQLPLLAALLVLACAGKAARAARSRSIAAGTGPTTMFPLHLRRPAAIAMCAIELALGLALIATAGRPIAWPAAAMVVRLGVVLLFATATAALVELKAHRPDIGCGCFGDLSSTPISLRTIARSALFTIAAAATLGVPPVRLTADGLVPGAAHGTLGARLLVAALVAEVVLLAALSPELGEALVRLGYREPCERRALPRARTLAALRSSRAWRRYAEFLTSAEPTDVWRELCWRYAVFSGDINDREADIVFAVFTRRWSPPVRAAIVDAVTGEVLARSVRRTQPIPSQPIPAADPDGAVVATRGGDDFARTS
ncbi:MAG TPA: MauE/DoxX family redox-associated membrane protein [Streptosporangiaceae bacterium]|nr:MauE/DoxX family redox-associated membrane protein [Streptosporangiaceae bacterium]